MKSLLASTALFVVATAPSIAQNLQNNPTSNHGNKFEQLGTILPDANTYRTASGAPGHEYWQQRADYQIQATLDEKKQYLHGEETITYFNNSPDGLTYLWLQLDENEHNPNGENNNFNESGKSLPLTPGQIDGMDVKARLAGYGVNILSVTDAAGNALPYTINQTMMRVDLPTTLLPGQKFVFNITWSYKISDRLVFRGRGGYELFPEDGNSVFTMAQWFPRLCVYSDFQGWQNHQFTGRGEFALTFGNYNVSITAPADHVIMGTGECQNYAQVLTPAQLARWKTAQTAKDVGEVVTLEEAKNAEAIIGATGPSSPTFIVPALMNKFLNTKFKIVTGYKGAADLNLHLLGGSVTNHEVVLATNVERDRFVKAVAANAMRLAHHDLGE